MDEQQIEQLGFVLSQLFSAYANAKVDEGTTAVYIRLLADIPPADLQTVIDQCIAECKFLPTVAEIRERWHALAHATHHLPVSDAWGIVKSEIRRIGSWGTPTFDDPLIAKVVKNMGWLELCMSESPEGVDRAQFERAYNDLAQRSTQMQKLLPQAREMVQARTSALLTAAQGEPA